MMGRSFRPWRVLRTLRVPKPRLPQRPGVVLARVVVALLVMAAVGGGLARMSLDTSMGAFLPAHDPTVRELGEKADAFGGDPIVVLLETDEPRALFDDPEQLMDLLKLEGRLSDLDDVAAVYGPASVLNQTAGAAQDFLAELSGRRDGYQQLAISEARRQGMSDAAAKETGERALARFDRRYGSLLVKAMPAGLPTLKNPKFVDSVLFDDQGAPRGQWRFVVPSSRAVAVLVRPRADLDQAAAGKLTHDVRRAVDDSGLRLGKSTVTGVPVVEAGLTERLRQEAPLLGGIAIVAVGLVFLLSPWTPRVRARLRPVSCALLGTAATLSIFGWIGHELSLGVIAFLPILLGIGSDFPLYLSRGGHDRAAVVAASAALVGFASLMISPLPFVQQLGLSLVIGLAITVGLSLLLRRVFGPVPAPSPSRDVPNIARPRPIVRAVVASIAVATACAGWVALPQLQIEADPERLAAGLPEVTQARHAETLLRSMGEINIAISGKDVATPAVLDWQSQVEERIVRQFGDRVHPAISMSRLLRFLGDKPTQGQFDAAMDLMPTYLTSSVVTRNHRHGVMVLGVEFDDVAELGPLLDGLRDVVAHPPAGTEVAVVGLPVAGQRGLELVSGGRLWVNLVGLGAAAVVLLVGFRRRSREATGAIVTAVLSTGWITLLAWATTGTLSPLTIAVGSLATATSCEFAIMLRRRELVRPVAVAAVAGVLGYLVIALSELSVLREFGLLLAGGVACSFVAALAVTRVILPDLPDTAGDGHKEQDPSAEPAVDAEEILV